MYSPKFDDAFGVPFQSFFQTVYTVYKSNDYAQLKPVTVQLCSTKYCDITNHVFVPMSDHRTHHHKCGTTVCKVTRA